MLGASSVSNADRNGRRTLPLQSLQPAIAAVRSTFVMLRCGPSKQSFVRCAAFWRVKRQYADKEPT